jgi:DNA-binding MarR family transcriptional regulator
MMTTDDDAALRVLADEVLAHYVRLYEQLHTRWGKPERRLSPEAVALLTHLSRSGPLTVAEACRHFDRAQSATSELFDRLEERGLLVRFKDSRDRRRTLVWLSDEGAELLRKALSPLDPARLRQALQRLPAADRDALLRGLAALVHASAIPHDHTTEDLAS